MAYTDFPEITGLTGQSRSGFTNLLKDVQEKLWDAHIHTKTKIASCIAQKKGRMGGRKMVRAVTTKLPQSAGMAIFEGHPLPEPDIGTYLNPQIQAKNYYTRIRITGNVRRGARGKKNAWARPLKKDMKDARSQMDLNFSRKFYLGPYDSFGPVASYAASVFTLSGRGARTSAVNGFFVSGAHYLRVGMDLSFVANSGGNCDLDGRALSDPNDATNERVRISAIDTSDPDAPTFTIESATPLTAFDTGSYTPAANDMVIPFGSRRHAVIPTDDTFEGYFAGGNGIFNVVGDSTIYPRIYTLSKTSNPSMSGIHLKNSGTSRPYQEMMTTLLIDRIADEGTGMAPDKLMMNRAVRREFLAEHEGDRRFAPVQTERGFGKLAHTAGDEPLVVECDTWCPPGLALALCTRDKAWGWYSESDLKMGEPRWVADKDQNEFWSHKSGNVECESPFNNGLYDDITYDTEELTAA